MSECTCVNMAPRMLRGVTRTVRITVLDKAGNAVDLSVAREVVVTVSLDGAGASFAHTPGFTVAGDDNNVVEFPWYADEQKRCGRYTIDVNADFGNRNQSRVDFHREFGVELVEHSCDVSGEPAEAMEVDDDLDLEGTLEVTTDGMSAFDQWRTSPESEGYPPTEEGFFAWIRQPATDAATAAAAQMSVIQGRADEDHTRAGQDHTRAESDHGTASSDHTLAAGDHTQAGNDHTQAVSDHGTAADDHTLAASDHTLAASDHGTAASDHTLAASDHGTAATDHSNAASDHSRAATDHTTAAADHTQAGQDHSTAVSDHTTAASDHTTAGEDHTRAGNDHTTATDDHRIAAADHSTAADDHTLAASDHGTAAEDHRVAGIDHGTAADDHTRAGNDHQTASDDHTQAGSDHTRAGEDHTRAGDDHTTASGDHTRAGEDHTTAGNDHTRAGEDHTQAGNDHTRAEADHGIAADDHTQATADHAVMAGYDTRLGNVESEVTKKYTKPEGGIPESDIAPGVIPTVPAISTDIPADRESDAKTASPKAVATALGKWGVISQILHWSGTPQVYSITDIVRGIVPQDFIDTAETIGAVFNESTGYFELNGLTDISYKEMLKISMMPLYFNRKISSTNESIGNEARYGNLDIRTNGIFMTTTSANFGDCRYMFYGSNFEVINLTQKEANNNTIFTLASTTQVFYNNLRLKKIIGAFVLGDYNGAVFSNCYTLESLRIHNLGFNVRLVDASRLDLESVVYMVDNAANTSAITISLHATAYARCQADTTEYTYSGQTYTGILAYAAAKNITIAT